ncbi:MAG: hypothetical protein ACFE0O_01955 [Opitutales bacterium]
MSNPQKKTLPHWATVVLALLVVAVMVQGFFFYRLMDEARSSEDAMVGDGLAPEASSGQPSPKWSEAEKDTTSTAS